MVATRFNQRAYDFECSIRGSCPRCGSAVDYSCECPNGDPEFPLVTYDDQRAEAARARRALMRPHSDGG